jgi:hypothetical protein
MRERGCKWPRIFNCWWASALVKLNIQRARPLYLFTIYFSLYGMVWTETQFFLYKLIKYSEYWTLRMSQLWFLFWPSYMFTLLSLSCQFVCCGRAVCLTDCLVCCYDKPTLLPLSADCASSLWAIRPLLSPFLWWSKVCVPFQTWRIVTIACTRESQ